MRKDFINRTSYILHFGLKISFFESMVLPADSVVYDFHHLGHQKTNLMLR